MNDVIEVAFDRSVGIYTSSSGASLRLSFGLVAEDRAGVQRSVSVTASFALARSFFGIAVGGVYVGAARHRIVVGGLGAEGAGLLQRQDASCYARYLRLDSHLPARKAELIFELAV